MQTTEAFVGLRSLTGGERSSPDSGIAPDSACATQAGLTPVYDDDALAAAHETLFNADGGTELDHGSADGGLARFGPVLPFETKALVSLGEGTTPLVSAPELSTDWEVDVLIKDEGRNPTGGISDREMALAVTGARERETTTVSLPTTGNGGQSAAAYAARAGIDAHAFVPSRSSFDTKAMTNVHGGEMTVVGGRYPDAFAAFEQDGVGESLAPFETPYRHEGVKTLAYELVSTDPDAVVLPVSHGHWVLGVYRGFVELVSTGVLDSLPRLYAVQPEGCAPIVNAVETGGEVTSIEHPDTICGSLEVPAPAGGVYAVKAVSETDGGAVAVSDHALLDAALATTQTGIPLSATGGTAIAGGEKLAESGAFDDDECVVVIDPATANRETDLLRSRLMSKGV